MDQQVGQGQEGLGGWFEWMAEIGRQGLSIGFIGVQPFLHNRVDGRVRGSVSNLPLVRWPCRDSSEVPSKMLYCSEAISIYSIIPRSNKQGTNKKKAIRHRQLTDIIDIPRYQSSVEPNTNSKTIIYIRCYILSSAPPFHPPKRLDLLNALLGAEPIHFAPDREF